MVEVWEPKRALASRGIATLGRSARGVNETGNRAPLPDSDHQLIPPNGGTFRVSGSSKHNLEAPDKHDDQEELRGGSKHGSAHTAKSCMPCTPYFHSQTEEGNGIRGESCLRRVRIFLPR